MSARGLFITGTNTEVGKTHVTAMIAKALVAEGRRVGVYKPVASGCRLVGGELIADDAVQLWEAAGRPGSLERVCPQRYLAPLAPHRAAAAEGRKVDAELLAGGAAWWRERCELLLVEGAGGAFSPLADDLYNAELAAQLGLPTIVVAANQLGVIHAVLSTVWAMQARAPSAAFAGVVLNQCERRDGDESLGTNATEIAQRSPAPLLATVAFGDDDFAPAVDWQRLAS